MCKESVMLKISLGLVLIGVANHSAIYRDMRVVVAIIVMKRPTLAF